MEKFKTGCYINFTDEEYEYLKTLCHSMYDNLKKFPKKMRTPKFYILENMIERHF